jgi:hypothetical protein
LHWSTIFSENRYPLLGIMLFAFEHDLFRKAVATFRDHAPEHFVAAAAALVQPGDERAALWQSRPEFANLEAITGSAE